MTASNSQHYPFVDMRTTDASSERSAAVGTIDPNVAPLSADELARDAAASPQGPDQPPLTEAQNGEDSATNDDAGRGDQSRVIDTALTNLPPG